MVNSFEALYEVTKDHSLSFSTDDRTMLWDNDLGQVIVRFNGILQEVTLGLLQSKNL